jgi:hypothetical protein
MIQIQFRIHVQENGTPAPGFKVQIDLLNREDTSQLEKELGLVLQERVLSILQKASEESGYELVTQRIGKSVTEVKV